MFYALIDLIGLHWIIINTVILMIVYQCVVRYWSYFSERGVKFVRGWPILGTQYKMLLGKQAMSYAFQDIYDAFPDESFVGMYEVGGNPVYVVRDPELIKQITTKDFEHFANHRFEVSDESDKLLGRALFLMRDQKWKNMRSTLSPAFTGSKMRLMLDLILDCSDDFCNFLRQQIDSGTVVYDAKDLFQRFASNTIATCAFGMKVNSLEDRLNEFYVTGNNLTDLSGVTSLKFFAYLSMPKVMNFFRVKIFADKDCNYMRNIVHSNIQHRKENGIFRPDMIHLLMEAQKGELEPIAEKDEDVGFATVHESNVGKGSKLQKWEDDDVTAQCMIFLLAGFSAISGGLCFLAHELAMNPDIQARLYKEIVEVQASLGGKALSYEILQKMTYMDMVVSETLRRWSLNPVNDRFVNKPYILEDSNGKRVQLNVGDGVFIPACGIHMDPKYYPNPEIFDPERFNDENKHNIRPGTYLPFGIGPRNCIASRFALMQLKSLFYNVVRDFVIERCEKTQHPLKLKASTNTVEAEKGFWLQFRRRV